MATLKEFETTFCEVTGENPNSVRHIARMLQDAGHLPKGKRGMSKNAPQLTIEQGAMFALGYYGSTIPKFAGETAARLSKLKEDFDGPTLVDRFVELIKVNASQGGNLDDVCIEFILFIHWELLPSVSYEWKKLSERDKWDEKQNYVTVFIDCDNAAAAKKEIESQQLKSQKVPAFKIEGNLFHVIADALGLVAADG